METANTDADLDLASLPPMLRVLLITDGTVTRTLEACFLEPIEVQALTHAETISDGTDSDIEAPPGEPVLDRHVVLRGSRTRIVYAVARSRIACAQLPSSIRRQLVEEGKGIGELLAEYRLGTHREIVSATRTSAAEWATELEIPASAPVLVRRYRIRIGGRVVIAIREAFPLARYLI